MPHKISNGHYLLGMGGGRLVHSELATLTSCDILNVKDNLKIELKNEFIIFHLWKTNFKEWDFGSDSTVSL